MSNFDKIYSNEDYIQHITVARIKDENFNSDTLEYDQTLPNELINSVNIISDIKNPLLVANIHITDVDNQFIHRIIPDGYTMMRIVITKIQSHETEVQFKQLFIIKDIKLVSKESNLYVIDLVSVNWFYFNNLLVYSTMNKEENLKEKTHTEIIFEMMKKGKIKVNKPELQTTYKQQYVTPANYTLRQSIADVITAVDSDTGLIFLLYDFIKSEYNIKSIKQIFNDNTIINQNRIFFPTNNGLLDQRQLIQDAQLLTDISFDKIMHNTAPLTVKHFSYNKRAWTDTSYNRKKINGMFYKPTTTEQIIRFKDIAKFIPERKNTFEKLSSDFINDDQFRNVLLGTEYLQGELYGSLFRMAGQLMFIYIDLTSDLAKRMFGVWLVARVYHNFSGAKYTNTVQLCRVDYFKNIGKDDNGK